MKKKLFSSLGLFAFAPTLLFWVFGIPKMLAPENLIQNGDFEKGNMGFTTDLQYTIVSNWSPSLYTVGTSATAFQSNFSPCETNHTVGGSKMLIVNGSTIPNTKVWAQTISVQPNKTYDVSFWYENVMPSADNLKLQLFVNGVMVAEDLTGTIPPCSWYKAQGTWASGNNTTAVIEIMDNYNAFHGDDFAIDDIVFKEVTNIENSANNPIDINIGSNPVEGELDIKLTNATATVELMLINEQGQVVATRILDGNNPKKETIFDTQHLSNGWYVLKVKSDVGAFSKKFVVMK
jgi:Secretion system C-terminal sorting domain